VRARRWVPLTLKVLVSATLAGTVVAAVPVAASASTCQQWSSDVPNVGTGDSLSGTAVTSACNAWAVGTYSSGTAVDTLIDHWNGTAWSQVASPNPGSDLNFLSAAAATSASSAWAVGTYHNAANATLTLIEHWNGTAWTQVPSPSPSGTAAGDVSFLYGVAATSASSAWAVGTTGFGDQALIEHWNGTAWTQVPSPNLGGGQLESVTATSASNAWAVGTYTVGSTAEALIEHWNGTAWTQVPSPNLGSSDLKGVSATSASNAWAVGDYTGGTLIEHWNGTAWTQVPSPNPGDGTGALFSVASISASDALAAGSYSEDDGDEFLTLVEQWNGTAWEQVASQSPTDSSFLFAVAATSSFDAGAVGYYDGSTTSSALAEHV
jgi:hypothetical protein